ncbi:MAG: ribosome maturation factor RimM [Sulfuricaulis sp.]|uniref:ribosome maturation factor RimM n=1 Tax=Sulfuricaulis sp. TaxID=2003553 RepID=UPI0025D0ADE6|nr:ribosome maturation factor RimM [Sulfuricaulis sp.]MCR4347433.1 ribosome maturation factor RimM [Sulfuricaulis sp.]
MADPSRPDGLVHFGRITGLFGVQGWVKVFSHARPRESIIDYSPWLVKTAGDWRELVVEEGRAQGKGVVAKLAGVDDRDQASQLIGADIEIKFSQLPPLLKGEYYWTQLVGLEVVNLAGERLGKVDHLVETGANDVLVVLNGKERWLPVTAKVIRGVDLEAGVIRVDWEADF